MWHQPTQPIVIDTDIGDDVDDAFGLALALALPELDIRAVTTVAGPVATRTHLAQVILSAAGRGEVPGAPGSSMMSDGRPAPGRFSHQPVLDIADFRLQIADLAFSPESTISNPRSAIDLIVQCSHDQSPLTIVALGPLTNIAAALDTIRAWRGERGWSRRPANSASPPSTGTCAATRRPRGACWPPACQ